MKFLLLACLLCFASCSSKHVSSNGECIRADYCDKNDPYGCAGIVTLNTFITTFDAVVITPLNVVWITLLAYGCAAQPTTVTSQTTAEEKKT